MEKIQKQQLVIVLLFMFLVATTTYVWKNDLLFDSTTKDETEAVFEEPDVFDVTEEVIEEATTTVPEKAVEVVVPKKVVLPPPIVEYDEYAITSLHIATLLIEHNKVRSDKGLSPFTWSPVLAVSAQAWADNLGARNCEMEHSTTKNGENIYYYWSTGSFKLEPKLAVEWWADEEKYYNYDKNSCRSGEVCGHYTQIVWKDTTQVGCAVSVCTEGKKKTQMWVCQYNPPGNYTGMKPY